MKLKFDISFEISLFVFLFHFQYNLFHKNIVLLPRPKFKIDHKIKALTVMASNSEPLAL